MTASVWFDFQEQKGSPSCPLDPAQVLRQCEVALGDQPPRFHRTFIRQSNGNAGAIRVMQWNILAQGKKRLLSDAIFTQILWLHVCTSDVGWAQTIHPNVTSTSQNYGMGWKSLQLMPHRLFLFLFSEIGSFTKQKVVSKYYTRVCGKYDRVPTVTTSKRILKCKSLICVSFFFHGE